MRTVRRSGQSRPGFTLAEMIVVVAVIIALAAIILPQVANQAKRGGTAALAQDLSNVSSAILSFRGDVQHYPSTLAQLAQPLVAGDVNVCGGNMPAVVRNRWTGPYVQRAVPATGLPSGDATILNALVRQPASGAPNSSGTLFIVAINVDQAVATELEAQFDGDSDFSGGTIRWTSGDTLQFAMPITGC